MTSRLLISLSVLFFAAQKISAQLAPAEDFFNGGAQLYISNNIPQAKEVVGMGLKLHPDDEKLKKLEALLNQKQQQNQQQQNQQDQSKQQKSDSQKNQQQQKQQQQKQDSQDQQKQDEQKKGEQQKQQQASAQKKEDEKQDKQDAESQPVKAGEMTPEEAKRLLDAQKDGEQLLQMKPQDKPHNLNRPAKDW